MSILATGTPRSVKLADLIALNEEIAALIRAGVPLEAGLARVGRDLPGMGALASRLASRMQQGQSLAAALAAEGKVLPEIYVRVVEAGLRSGRLAVALEAMSQSARRLAEVRRMTGAALVYPLLVVLLAWHLFCYFALKMSHAYEQMAEARTLPTDFVLMIRPWIPILAPTVPIVIGAVLAVWWIGTGRASSDNRLAWLPRRRQLLAHARAATFAETLALLIDQRVPLPDALRLAARTSNTPELETSSSELAAALEAGQNLAERAELLDRLPPLVRWLLLSSPSPETLAEGLHGAARSYQRQAARLAERMSLTLPLLLTAVLGGSAAVAYASVVYLPWVRAVWRLAQD